MADDALPDIDLNDYEEISGTALCESESLLKENMEVSIDPSEEGGKDMERDPDDLANDDDSVENEAITVESRETPSEKDLFEIPEKPKKKKRQMTEKQKAALAKAREKGNMKRKAMALARKKEEAMIKAEKKAHIKKRRQKQLEQEALIEEMAETSVMKKEQDLWDEEKLVSLMNRTMDTYFHKRQEEKTRRQQFPVDPAVYANYQPAQPPVRSKPKPAPKARALRNPYSQLFGLSADDEDLFNL